jgi:hypothetical protein
MSLELIDPQTHRQLFLDDYAVETMDGVRRVLHRPELCGPLIRGGCQSRNTPLWNPQKGLWEWWYMGGDKHYATSPDGEQWQVSDSTPAEGAPPLYHVVRDEAEEDPCRRYKGLFGSGGRQLAVSPDGFDWTMLDRIIPSQDESQFTHDVDNGRFLAFVKLGTEWGRSVWLSQSDDFEQFTDPELIFHADEIDWENCRQRVRKIVDDPAYLSPPMVDDVDYKAEIYNMAVLPYQGMYIGFPTVFNPIGAIPPPATNYTRINQIELAVSRDLRHWERLADREVFIGVEPWRGDNYGTCQLLASGAPVVRDNGEIWCYYNALRLPGSRAQYQELNRSKELFRLGVTAEALDDGGALSLAKLPQDRFVGLEADEAGQVLTKPFELKGQDVYINADAQWGKIYVEVADAQTRKAHTGFWVPLEEPAPFVGNQVRAKVQWKPQHEMVFEQPVRLRFYLHQARLYSFWLE